MTIGERIKNTREKLQMSQVDFAYKINVSKQTLYKYENNIITNIPSDKIEAIATIGKVSPAYLMGWIDNQKEDDLIDYFNDTLEDIILFLEKNGYTTLQTDSSSDDSIIIKNKNGQIIKTTTCGQLVGQYEKMKIENLPKTIENLLDIESTAIFPERIRSAARGMMDLSDSDQELAINMIHSLAMKGRKANED